MTHTYEHALDGDEGGGSWVEKWSQLIVWNCFVLKSDFN